MNHILVLPDELRVKLNAAYADTATQDKWFNIGVNTVDELIGRVVDDLNLNYPVLSIISTREESSTEIKARIKSSGNVSKYVGYFENESGNVDGLFFYISPDAANANDFVAAKVMPPLFGIYNNIKDRTRDRHIHCMPVFIVNLCTTSRVHNESVKKQFICCETSGFYYLDIFQNEYHDVIGKFDADGNIIPKLDYLNELDDFLGGATNNKWFEVDNTNHIVRILSTTLEKSSNLTADIYRLSLYVIPAVYMAANEEYEIDITSIAAFDGNAADTLRTFIEKF